MKLRLQPEQFGKLLSIQRKPNFYGMFRQHITIINDTSEDLNDIKGPRKSDHNPTYQKGTKVTQKAIYFNESISLLG